MRAKEAIHILDHLRPADTKDSFEAYIVGEALAMAINALEQEPTKEEKALLQKWRDNRGISIEDFEDALNALQEPKTGHWIEKDGFDGDVYYDCSECGESWTTIEGTPWQNGMAYCPNCGARMAESEDKCKNCKYYRNPDYTRCHKCKAESEGCGLACLRIDYSEM